MDIILIVMVFLSVTYSKFHCRVSLSDTFKTHLIEGPVTPHGDAPVMPGKVSPYPGLMKTGVSSSSPTAIESIWFCNTSLIVKMLRIWSVVKSLRFVVV